MKKNDSCKYLFTETAGFDLNGTGKKDHVAQLGTDGYRLELFVTDKDNNQVTETLKFDNEFPLSLRTFEQRGAISLVCGDFNGDGKDTIVRLSAGHNHYDQKTAHSGVCNGREKI